MQTGPMIVVDKPRLLKEVPLDEFCGAVDWVSEQGIHVPPKWHSYQEMPRYFKWLNKDQLAALDRGWHTHRRFALRQAGGKGSRPLMIFPDDWASALTRRLGLQPDKYDRAYDDGAVFPDKWDRLPCVGDAACILYADGPNEGLACTILSFDKNCEVCVKYHHAPLGTVWKLAGNVYPRKDS